ncbi:unnamed protein product [Ectocarpus sp. 6 AP-2014]
MAMRRLVKTTALPAATLIFGATAFRPMHTAFPRCSGLGSNTTPLPRVKMAKIAQMAGRPDGIDDAICNTPDPSTKDFIMQQTMLRIKNPHSSLDFYTRVLGMRLMQELHFAEWEFSIYFVGYCDPSEIPSDPKERTRWCFQQAGAVELTHNWGTENDAALKYHSGNEDPRGFGHIGITVPDVYKACERFEKEGVNFRKTPDGGNMKGLAFIFDPDGYSIEILGADQMSKDFSKYTPGGGSTST